MSASSAGADLAGSNFDLVNALSNGISGLIDKDSSERAASSPSPASFQVIPSRVNALIKAAVKTTQSSLLAAGILSDCNQLASASSVNSGSLNAIHPNNQRTHPSGYSGQLLKSLSLTMPPLPNALSINDTAAQLGVSASPHPALDSSASASASASASLASSDIPSSVASCPFNCSGHGECYNGICFCHVEYSGSTCDNPNLSYFIAFSTVFYMICLVSLVQLVLCIKSEFDRMKPRSLLRAFRITTQKALYFFICLATGLRGFYFAYIPETGHMLTHHHSHHSHAISSNLTLSTISLGSSLDSSTEQSVTPDPSSSPYPHHMNVKEYSSSNNWTAPLLSAYYPLLMSGSSLVVCFWAELFHLHDVSPERPGFLSKSFTGFILFNVVTYSLLLAELVLLRFAETTETERSLFLSIFNSIYAVLMLVVVVFFLIYGVEVYFKLRGAFIQGESNAPADFSQLQQSRLGLISQAVLLLITVLFIFSDVLGSFWKNKVPILSRNTHEIMFRVVELGVALWFPCVLWNCVQPEALWILNPRKILKRAQRKSLTSALCASHELKSLVDVDGKKSSETTSLAECWICYDTERTDAGPLMQPCACKGDVAAVHHDCLKTWLMESNCNPDSVKCKVCNEAYRITRGEVWLPSGLTISHYLQTATIIVIMFSAATSVWMVVKLFDHMYVRTISVGSAILVEYICLRFLGFNIISAYNRAKFSAIKIKGKLLIQSPEVLQQSDTSNTDCSTSSSSSYLPGSSVESSPSSSVATHNSNNCTTDSSESKDNNKPLEKSHQQSSSTMFLPSSMTASRTLLSKCSPLRRAIAASIADNEFDDTISSVEEEAASIYSLASSNAGSSCSSSRSCSFRCKMLSNSQPASRHHSYCGTSVRDEQIALACNLTGNGTVVEIHCVEKEDATQAQIEPPINCHLESPQ